MFPPTRTILSHIVRLCLTTIVLVLVILGYHKTARADQIAVWNFNDSDLVVDHGSGTLTTNFNPLNIVFTLGGTTNNARLGDPAGQSATLQGGTSNGNNGRFLNLSVSTVGFSNIIVSFATQATSTGFNSNQFQYSVDGLTFVDFGVPYSPTVTFSLVTFDLSSVTALNDNPNAMFRIVFNGATSSSGNNRLDNLVVDGQSMTSTTIPEPTSIALLAFGLSGLVLRRKRARGWIHEKD